MGLYHSQKSSWKTGYQTASMACPYICQLMLCIWLLDANRTIYRSRQHVKVDRDPDLRQCLNTKRCIRYFGARVVPIGTYAAENPTLDETIFTSEASRVFAGNLQHLASYREAWNTSKTCTTPSVLVKPGETLRNQNKNTMVNPVQQFKNWLVLESRTNDGV